MTRHIQIMTTLVMVMLINSASLAQGKKEKEIMGIAEIQTKRMEAKLNLTDDQTEHVMQINLQFMNDIRAALKNNEDEDLLTEAEIMRSIQEKNNALREVLTVEQMSELLLSEIDRLLIRKRHI
ncbi:hypothetical protein ACFLU5_03040 [Bacteroidota bacterium]